jgi:hypothetical protein
MGQYPEITKNIREAAWDGSLRLIRTLERLEDVYPHYIDIDLIIGGLAERPLSGILMGLYPEIQNNIREAGGRLPSLYRH